MTLVEMIEAKLGIPDLEPLKGILLEAAQESTVEGVLKRLVEGVCRDRPNVCGAIIWLLETRKDGTQELVLSANASRSGTECSDAWSRITPQFQRVPIDETLIGKAILEGKAVSAADPAKWTGGYPAWAKEAEILAYSAQP